MGDPERPVYPHPRAETQGEGLRQALLRLTSPRYEALQAEIAELRKRLDSLNARHIELTDDIQRQLLALDLQVSRRHDYSSGQIEMLQAELADLEESIREEQRLFLQEIDQQFKNIHDDLVEPDLVAARLSPVLVPVISERVRQDQDEFAEAIGPVIGPAIRRQIRESRQDIIDALYPIIGQIISKAISESIRELTRNIDARLRQQLNFRARIERIIGRVKGVSEAEMLLREALPFSVERVFLIHRQSGLLLTHLSVDAGWAEEMDTVSGMLTAIRDFVRDSFGQGEGDLEEIAHGERRILLESGQYAYVAAVITGVEPSGYNELIRDTIHEIHVTNEKDLRNFDGDMDGLPDFRKSLNPLLSPGLEPYSLTGTTQPFPQHQKWLLVFSTVGVLLLLALIAFGCIFTIRLWPVAFSGLSALPSATSTAPPMIIAPATLTASVTATLSPSSTRTPTRTRLPPSPTVTETSLPEPSASPAPVTGVLQGNLNVRAGPSRSFQILGTIAQGERVEIHQRQDGWFYVRWPVVGETRLEGWIWGERYLSAED